MSITTPIRAMEVLSLALTPLSLRTSNSASSAITGQSITAVRDKRHGLGVWTPNGYGGGVMASYWDKNFYLQSAGIAFMDNIARASARILDEFHRRPHYLPHGHPPLVPFLLGRLDPELQATAILNGNEDASYTESGGTAPLPSSSIPIPITSRAPPRSRARLAYQAGRKQLIAPTSNCLALIGIPIMGQ